MGNKMNEGNQTTIETRDITANRKLLTTHYFLADYIITMSKDN